MTDAKLKSDVEDLLYREALFLDEQRWDDWLALYVDEIEFWAPAWKSEHQPTGDPKAEISLIYMTSKKRLEERVARIRSGKSAAALVLPRTAHSISNILLDDDKTDDLVTVASLCVTHIYDPKRRHQYQTTARYTHRLIRHASEWRIQGKKIIVLNDELPSKLDFYTL